MLATRLAPQEIHEEAEDNLVSSERKDESRLTLEAATVGAL